MDVSPFVALNGFVAFITRCIPVLVPVFAWTTLIIAWTQMRWDWTKLM